MLTDLDAVQLSFLDAGHADWHRPAWVHEKTVPFSILAQVVKGQYEVTYRGQTHSARRGELFYAPPHTPLHIFHRVDARQTMAAQWVHFTFTAVGGLDLLTLFDVPPVFRGKAAKRIGAIIESLLRPQPADALSALRWTAERAASAWSLVEIVCGMSRPCVIADAMLHRTERIAPLLDHLRRHVADPIDIAAMARLAHLSESRLYAHFKAHLGTTPLAYLKRARLNQAGYDLAQTDLSLTSIAERVGFQNPFHLSREFKRQFGVPPSAYRKLNRRV